MIKYFVLATICSLGIAATNAQVKVTGAMRNVMQKGELHGTIYLDTIAPKAHLYGVGPLEYLKGEILILDGVSYVSRVGEGGAVTLAQTFDVKAPFLVYANNSAWDVYDIPKHITTMKALEDYITKLSAQLDGPFVFKLEGEFEHIAYHIQNLPDGAVVRSPADAHVGQGKYTAAGTKGTIVGFFSTQHQRIFTHHDSYIHLHYIDKDKTVMGHVDDLQLHKKSRVKLYIPKK